MKIDNNNIEEYIFDYLEGNLSGKELAAFKAHVNSNPEANADMQYWKQSYVGSNSTAVNSSDFSSLKKSNKMYYWAGGVAAAFLLGITTMAVISDNQTINTVPQNKIEQAEVNSTTVIIEDAAAEKVEAVIIQKAPEISGTIIEEDIIIEESIQNENMNFASNRDINMDSSESNREVSGAIKIKKVIEETTSKKTNKEVDVIELNSEGF